VPMTAGIDQALWEIVVFVAALMTFAELWLR
jgi:hypothetical protein